MAAKMVSERLARMLTRVGTGKQGSRGTRMEFLIYLAISLHVQEKSKIVILAGHHYKSNLKY
ncbi:hypothetical protein TorRG33x02_156510 [Trema orientale]|uniref:Uncharacterized protein n=1 Tax=Trema orientale TaxID=63057 RepID=A0A2P5ESS0_TREOI|nr:hypothetical protein TorRG33x02_156510 [Trema orientale]